MTKIGARKKALKSYIPYLCKVKKVTVILCALLIFSLASKDLISYLHFSLNQDYIAENLCINIYRTDIMCSGKCYFQELIKTNHEQEETPSITQAENINFVVFPFKNSDLQPFSRPEEEAKLLVDTEMVYTYAHLDDIFHPPRS